MTIGSTLKILMIINLFVGVFITDIFLPQNGCELKTSDSTRRISWIRDHLSKTNKNIQIDDSGKGIRINNREFVSIRDCEFNLIFENNRGKYDTSFIYIKNCKNVDVVNIKMTQLNHDYRAYHSILIEDCDSVKIKNSSFFGTCKSHIRIEGCKVVMIDNVEIAGYSYGKYGIRCGGGIWINNGEHTEDKRKGIWSLNPKDLESLTITNSYIHDNLNEDKIRNNDGILIHSAGNGSLFNNRFENWIKGDSALDISHRRSDDLYKNKTFLVKNNIFLNNKHVKSNGFSHDCNLIIWEDNIYVDTMIGNYHSHWNDVRWYETHIFTKDKYGFWRNWSELNGKIYIKRCLIYIGDNHISEMFKFDGGNTKKAFKMLVPEDNIYFMTKDPSNWLVKKSKDNKRNEYTIKDWESWRKSGFDCESTIIREKENLSFSNVLGVNIVVFQPSIETIEKIGDSIKRDTAGKQCKNINSFRERIESVLSKYKNLDFLGRERTPYCYGAVCY
jgi:hypothetical protein